MDAQNGGAVPEPKIRAKSQEVLMMEKRTSVHRQDKRRQILCNVLVVSSSFAFLFAAFAALGNLQSSINMEQGLGTYGLATIYAFLVLSCMFVPSALIQSLGCKWTMAVSIIGYVIYIAANFYPTWFTIYPASAIVGFSAAPLWSAKCSYLTSIGVAFARMSRELPEIVISRFFGIFFTLFQSSTVVGNAISSIILSLNVTEPDSSLDLPNHCGRFHCPDDNNTNLKRPDDMKLYVLLSVYVALAVAAFLILSLFLSANDEGDDDMEEQRFDPRALVATFLQLKERNQLLLIPITVYSGLEQGYFTSEYTQAYISCALGVWMVGYVMICYGVCDAVGSMVLARVNGVLGRPVMFGAGAVLHLACMIGLLLWRPASSDSKAIYFIIAGAWGLGDAVWQTQINAFYGTVFPEASEAAFANYRLWESIGFILAFGYSHVLCSRVKTYVVFIFLLIGMAGYVVTEVLWRQGSKPEPQTRASMDERTEL